MAFAKIVLFTGQPVDDPWSPYYQTLDTGVLQPPTTTRIVMVGESGARIVYHGDFTVVGGQVTGGTMTGFDVFAGSTKFVSATGYAISGAALFDALNDPGFIGQAYFDLFNSYPIHLVGSDRDDRAYGTPGADKLLGRAGNDRLQGGDGNDVLKGGRGNDALAGQNGKDTLYGGPGKDVFEYEFYPDWETGKSTGPTGFDKIKDFQVGKDLIGLSFYLPGSLPPEGYLEKQYFHRGKQATTEDHRVIYFKKKGKIFVDLDGTGSDAKFLLAKVTPGTKLDADDFFVKDSWILQP